MNPFVMIQVSLFALLFQFQFLAIWYNLFDTFITQEHDLGGGNCKKIYSNQTKFEEILIQAMKTIWIVTINYTQRPTVITNNNNRVEALHVKEGPFS